MAWVFDQAPVERPSDLCVLLVLADHARDDGAGAYPSIETIAHKSRLKRRAVLTSLQRLKSLGLIEAVGRGPRQTVEYRLVMALGVQEMHGAQNAPVQDMHQGGAGNALVGVQDMHPNHPLTVNEPSVSVEQAARPPIDVIWSSWKGSTGRYRSVLTRQRVDLIRRRLREYPVEDLVAAVRGWRHDPHNRGENDRHRPYNDIELILRDAAHIERFRDLEFAWAQQRVSDRVSGDDQRPEEEPSLPVEEQRRRIAEMTGALANRKALRTFSQAQEGIP